LRRKAVLAVLALRVGEVVSTDQLIDIVWGDCPPAHAANALQRHVSSLRGVLGVRSAITACPPGYLLDLPGEPTDVNVAERLIRQGRQAADPVRSAALLREALALWRGRPLSEITGLRWLGEQADRLEQIRLEAVHALTAARLALGDHALAAPELEQLARQHPFYEPVHSQLMLALYRCGRQADALKAYRRLRVALREELGIDPSPALRQLQARVLRQDPSLDLSAPVMITRTPPAQPVPAQLPPVVWAFVGRRAELAQLDGLVTAGPGSTGRSPAVVISAVSGTAGVGKTALAVHWANRVRDRFPDGQLYVNLRGFDPGPALEPATAVRGFLDALGVPADRIPADLAAQTGLYRSLVAGRRMLVVLDNARDATQVRPLLPGAPGCLVVVTSRNQLGGLVAAEGAYPLALDLLTHDEARQLLAGRLGARRVATEPDAVNQLITLSARLPLALSIAAARAAIRPRFRLAAIADELARARGGLEGLATGDPETGVRSVFSWSYRALSEPAARLFRLLGLHPGPDLAAPAVASLAGAPLDRVWTPLAELAGAHLLGEHTPGRYAHHDLLRAYATELADVKPDVEACGRMLDHYLHSAYRAARCLAPHREPIPVAPARPGVALVEASDLAGAMAWFTVERPVLVAMTGYAFDTGHDAHAWQLAWTLETYLNRQGHRDDLAATQRIALAAGLRLGDRAAQARAHLGLGLVELDAGRLDAATRHFGQAGDLFRAVGDHNGQARIQLNLAVASARSGRAGDALDYARGSLESFRTAGNRTGQARALNSIGWYHVQLGDYERSLEYCERAQRLASELDDRYGEAASSDSCGYANHHLGRFAQAAVWFQRSADLFHQLGDRHSEATALAHLGDTHDGAGNVDAARDAWQCALDLLDQLGHPDAEPLRGKLRLDA
jgi:DNA-binding SARP family transcriptional activator